MTGLTGMTSSVRYGACQGSGGSWSGRPQRSPHRPRDRRRTSWRASSAPASMLPPERALAARYGVSRPLIREALRSVEELGLIETRPGRGTFVRSEAVTGMHRGVGVAILRRGVTAQQLSEARLTLECEAASLAATRATPEDLASLAVALERLEQSESIEHVRNDLVFHLGHRRSGPQPGHRDDARGDRAADGRAHAPQRRRPGGHGPQPALPPRRPRGASSEGIATRRGRPSWPT